MGNGFPLGASPQSIIMWPSGCFTRNYMKMGYLNFSFIKPRSESLEDSLLVG